MYCATLAALAFEYGSQLQLLGDSAFAECSSLQSIFRPSSTEEISTDCFSDCRKLSALMFGPGSRISILAQWAKHFARAVAILPL
jgi:hypothetical protein